VALIVLVAGGLAVLVVAKVRQAANRAVCWNNLRCLGQGLRDYRAWSGLFPSGTVANPDLPPDRRLSWHTQPWAFMTGGKKLLPRPELGVGRRQGAGRCQTSERQMTPRQGRGCPESDHQAGLERVTNDPVQGRSAERRWRVRPARGIQEDLPQPEEVEVVDQEAQ
jgi:hypothetical protein